MPRPDKRAVVDSGASTSRLTTQAWQKIALTSALAAAVGTQLSRYLECRFWHRCATVCVDTTCRDEEVLLFLVSLAFTTLYGFLVKMLEPTDTEVDEYVWPTAHNWAVTFHRWHVKRDRGVVTMTANVGMMRIIAVAGIVVAINASVALIDASTADRVLYSILAIGSLAITGFAVRAEAVGDVILIDHSDRVIFRNRARLGGFDDVDHVALISQGSLSAIRLVLKSGAGSMIDLAPADAAPKHRSFARHLADFIGCPLQMPADPSVGNPPTLR